MPNKEETYRIHRVGTITAGGTLVVFGVCLLLQSVFDLMSYQMIFSFWPLILIGLGVEVLLSNFNEKRIVYDKAAVVLLFVMLFFAIGMAVTDICLEAAVYQF